MERSDLAESTYQKAIELKPDYWSNYNALGVFYFRQGQYENAITQFKQVVLLTPNNMKGLNNLGAVYFYTENYDDAIKTYEKSLMIQENYIAYSNLATLYYFKGNYENSTKMFERALAISDTDHRLWGNLGASYSMLPHQEASMRKAYEKAISLAEEILLVNPNDMFVLSDLAAFHASIGNKSQALALAERIVQSNPKSVEIVYRLCEIYEDLGYREKAILWLKKSIQQGYSIELIHQTPGLKELCRDQSFKKFIDSLNIENQM
jgi:Flp pilus assembly protein TadD